MAGELRLVRPVSAPRADLWRACATTAGLEAWCADRVTGVVGPGGSLRLEWPMLGAELDLEVVDWAPERRIAFSDGDGRVALSLDDGGIALTHVGLGEARDLDGFRASWRLGLSLLAHGLERHAGASRRPVWFSRPVRTTARLAHLCLVEPAALASWFGAADTPFSEGDAYAVSVASGERITGRVLALSDGRDVLLSVREQNDSVLALRTFPSPRSENERVVAFCWSRFGPEVASESRFQATLSGAFERFVSLLGRSGAA